MNSVFNLSSKDKEHKIAKVAQLIPKWYDEDSIVNEPVIVAQISKLLKPNQWLRIEDYKHGQYDYSKPIDYNKQQIGMKPRGLWASKGEWAFGKGKELTLLEVDYSRILVLTTKADYLAFEDKYCRKILTNKKSLSTHKSSKIRKTKKKVCTIYINWNSVAKDYDGIAMVPFGKKYFNRQEMIEYENHLWVATYDVSSLVIWRHDGQNPINSTISLGNSNTLYKSASSTSENDSELDVKKVVHVIKQGIRELKKQQNTEQNTQQNKQNKSIK